MKENTKKYRNLTVSSVVCERAYGWKCSPMLRIQGQWLADCGFEIGVPVKVQCEEGKLIVMLDMENMLRMPRCPFVLYVGKKKLVKRKEFEKFLSETIQL